MRIFCLLILLNCFAPQWAKGIGPTDVSSWSLEADTDFVYVGSSEVTRGRHRFGTTDEIDASTNIVASNQVSQSSLLRLGVNWERFSFAPDAQTPLPDTLQSINLVIGADYQVTPTLLLRVEAQPGFYSDFKELRESDFNVPFVVGASYFVSKDFLCVLGFSVDTNRAGSPIYPAAGARWKIARQIVIDAILPDPQIDYELNRNVTLHVGATLKDQTYRLSDDFGSRRGLRELNDSTVDFTEIRAGTGVSWKVTRSVSLDLQGGCVPYRKFDFSRADYKVTSFDVAPFAQLSLNAKF
jgi:Domain of unknown function (DUF6268)